MIINSSDVTMTSHRKYQNSTTYASSGMTWGPSGIKRTGVFYEEDYTEETDKGKSSEKEPEEKKEDLIQQFNHAKGVGSPKIQNPYASLFASIRQQSLNYLFMLLFGNSSLKKFTLFDFMGGRGSVYGNNNISTGQESGGTYTETYSRQETETTTFSTTGTVKTSDGREIDFNLSLSMSRSFKEAYAKSVDFGSPLNPERMCDPLVINLDTPAASVSDQSFYFDLDADGESDKISNLSRGSGFLAFDKNGDGKINDGKELFGTASGDGFSDLAAYDKDNNGWIDENDEIFSKLCIWTKDEMGRDILYTLKEAGVGAICLKHAATDFALKSYEDNSTNALVRQTGVFLYENGRTGTLQHLDLAKRNP